MTTERLAAITSYKAALDNEFNNLVTLLHGLSEEVEKTKLDQTKKSNDFETQHLLIAEEKQKLDQRQLEFKKEEQRVQAFLATSASHVNLNVGGEKFETSRQTLN
jgi:hypothetical protein